MPNLRSWGWRLKAFLLVAASRKLFNPWIAVSSAAESRSRSASSTHEVSIFSLARANS